MYPEEVAASVVEGIRSNGPSILTHAEIRDEVRENYKAFDAAVPGNPWIPRARQALEDNRRKVVSRLRALPVKD